MGSEKVVHADDLQSGRLEVIFYFTLLITFVLAWYIIRDLVTMLPGAVQFFRMSGPNDKFATPEMSNVYLLFLTAYTGYKEFRKWIEPGKTPAGEAAQAVVPKAQVLRFKRGEVIVAFWTLLLVVSAVVQAERLITRMPNELVRVSFQSIGIWLGGLFSEGALRSRRKKKAEEAESMAHAGDHAAKILEYVAASGSINNNACQRITGLNRYQVVRLFRQLETEGTLKSEGGGRNVRYVKPGITPPK